MNRRNFLGFAALAPAAARLNVPIATRPPGLMSGVALSYAPPTLKPVTGSWRMHMIQEFIDAGIISKGDALDLLDIPGR